MTYPIHAVPFQSHAGSIEACPEISQHRGLDRQFQSHAGSIEARYCLADALGDFLGFNPTLVRLRLCGLLRLPARNPRFQSHAGSIEAHSINSSASPQSQFQSHAGSIEASCAARRRRDSRSCFNPTLVRLRLLSSRSSATSMTRFNPTLVRLRRCTWCGCKRRITSFNPTLVRLRPSLRKRFLFRRRNVSIPRWFD